MRVDAAGHRGHEEPEDVGRVGLAQARELSLVALAQGAGDLLGVLVADGQAEGGVVEPLHPQLVQRRLAGGPGGVLALQLQALIAVEVEVEALVEPRQEPLEALLGTLVVALVEGEGASQVGVEECLVHAGSQVAEGGHVAVEQVGALAIEDVQQALEGPLRPGVVEAHVGVVAVAQRLGHFRGRLALVIVRLEAGQGRRRGQQQAQRRGTPKGD